MCKVTLDKTANGHLYEDLKGIRGMEYPHKACMDRTHELSDAKYRQESFKICKTGSVLSKEHFHGIYNFGTQCYT